MSAHLLSLKIPVVEFPPRTLYSATKSYISEDDTFVICLFISSIGSYFKKKKKKRKVIVTTFMTWVNRHSGNTDALFYNIFHPAECSVAWRVISLGFRMGLYPVSFSVIRMWVN